MSALIPYAAPATSALAQAIINNPEETKALFGMAAQKIGRTYKSYKKRKPRPTKRKRLDSVPNTESIAHQEVNTSVTAGFETLGRKVLSATPLKLINSPDANFDYGTSPANVYHLNGFRWCAKFRNLAAVPIRVHVHFVQPVRENLTTVDLSTNMFIDNRSQSTKYSDFTTFATSNAWDPVQDCFKLNRRKFNVLKSLDFNLNALEVSTTVPTLSESGKTWRTFDNYYKCNTSFEFENTSSTLPMKPIWMLVYFETIFPSSTAQLADLQFNTQTIGYVRKKV